MPDRFQAEVVAALHVEDSGPEALLPSRRHFNFSSVPIGMHGIEVSGDQDAGFAGPRMRKAGADTAGKTLPAGDVFDRAPHDRHVAGGEVEHALDRGRIEGRAFAFHPAAQSLQHGLGFEGRLAGFIEILFVIEQLSG